MENVLEHLIRAVKSGDQSVIRQCAESGGRSRARQIAQARAEQARREAAELDQRIDRLKRLVSTHWVKEDARIAALRSGYDALAD